MLMLIICASLFRKAIKFVVSSLVLRLRMVERDHNVTCLLTVREKKEGRPGSISSEFSNVGLYDVLIHNQCITDSRWWSTWGQFRNYCCMGKIMWILLYLLPASSRVTSPWLRWLLSFSIF